MCLEVRRWFCCRLHPQSVSNVNHCGQLVHSRGSLQVSEPPNVGVQIFLFVRRLSESKDIHLTLRQDQRLWRPWATIKLLADQSEACGNLIDKSDFWLTKKKQKKTHFDYQVRELMDFCFVVVRLKQSPAAKSLFNYLWKKQGEKSHPHPKKKGDFQRVRFFFHKLHARLRRTCKLGLPMRWDKVFRGSAGRVSLNTTHTCWARNHLLRV